MPRSISQSERVTTEQRQQQSLTADIVNTRYRLQASDLTSTVQDARVRAVSGQGVESLTPLLHFAGVAKPLALDAVNVAAMIQVAGSPIFDEWVGCEVQLRRVTDGELTKVRLFPRGPLPAQEVPVITPNTRRGWRNRWPALLLLLALALALAIVYLIENWDRLVILLR